MLLLAQHADCSLPDARSSLLFLCGIYGITPRVLYSLTLSGIIATLLALGLLCWSGRMLWLAQHGDCSLRMLALFLCSISGIITRVLYSLALSGIITTFLALGLALRCSSSAA